jgi:hypothetical protein
MKSVSATGLLQYLHSPVYPIAGGFVNRQLMFVMTLVCCLWGVQSSHAGIYKWTDEDGVVHYSDVEPVAPGGEVSVDSAIPYDAEADAKRSAINRKELNAISSEVESELEQDTQEQNAEGQSGQEDKQPTREEIITAERERLEREIADLEAKPLSYFGSAKNKRLKIGEQKYRLEELLQDPDTYFGWTTK